MTNINFCAVIVNTDNYMYFFYDDNYAFGIDAAEPNYLLELCDKKLEHMKVYDKHEISMLKKISKRELLFSLTTHKHWDHSNGDEYLLSKNVPVYKHKNIFHLQIINQHNFTILCVFTPCHTTDHVCYVVNDKYCATGDFIFKIGCGCFFEGNSVDFIKSFKELDKQTDENVIFLYGHDYFRNNKQFAATKRFYTEEEDKLLLSKTFLNKKEEKALNPFLSTTDPVAIQKLREEKNQFK